MPRKKRNYAFWFSTARTHRHTEKETEKEKEEDKNKPFALFSLGNIKSHVRRPSPLACLTHSACPYMYIWYC